MFVLFLLIPLLAHAYVSWHVWQVLPVPTFVKVLVVLLMAAAFASFFVLWFMGPEKLPFKADVALYEVGTSWLIILLYLVLLFLVMDVLRLVRILPAGALHANLTTTLLLVLIVLGLLAYGNIHYHSKYRQGIDVASPRVKSHKRIVMLSDLHLGFHNRKAELRRWVNLINAERPDLVVLAGDLVDMSTYPLDYEDDAEVLRDISAPVFACLGNHEYISGLPQALAFYKKADIHLLRDDVAEVGDDLCIIGRDDRSNPHRQSLAQLCESSDTSRFRLLLDHQPYHLEEAEAAGIDFQFSGHTHHGQVWPLSWLTEQLYEKAFGRHQRGATQYYVSSGMGIWGGKFRIGTRSEYIVLTLTP